MLPSKWMDGPWINCAAVPVAGGAWPERHTLPHERAGRAAALAHVVLDDAVGLVVKQPAALGHHRDEEVHHATGPDNRRPAPAPIALLHRRARTPEGHLAARRPAPARAAFADLLRRPMETATGCSGGAGVQLPVQRALGGCFFDLCPRRRHGRRPCWCRACWSQATQAQQQQQAAHQHSEQRAQ